MRDFILHDIRHLTVTKRIVTSLFFFLWLGIFMSWIYVNKTYLKAACEQPRLDASILVDTIIPDKIQFKDTKFKPFRMHEYRLGSQLGRDTTRRITSFDEIPILFIPDFNDGSSQKTLAKMIMQRTARLPFKFTYFVIDFNSMYTLEHGTLLHLQSSFVEHAIREVMTMYPRVRPIIIGHYSGGVAGLSVVARWKNYELDRLKVTDLIIVQSSAIKTPGFFMDEETRKYYMTMHSNWTEKGKVADIGLVSFSGGVKDGSTHEQWAKLKNAIHVPTWTVNGTSDGTLDMEMTSCAPFLNHLADLLVEYGHHHKEKTGKRILMEFYRAEEERKQAHLPEEWRDEVKDDELIVEVGGTYSFEAKHKKWIDVRLQRSEFIWMNVSGSCLKSATLIRQIKHIRRKEQTNGSVVFNVFGVRRFEDVHVYLELNDECTVSVETNSKWSVYGYKIYLDTANDGHVFLLGTLIAGEFLMTVEGQKRSDKLEQQLFYFWWLFATCIYQMIHSIGSSLISFLIGMVATSMLFVTSTVVDWVLVNFYEFSPDFMIVPIKALHMTTGVWFGVPGVFIYEPLGLLTLFAVFAVPIRPVLYFPMVVGITPLICKASYFTHSQFSIFNGVTSAFLWFAFVAFVYMILNVRETKISRFWIHVISACAILFHVAFPNEVLETHWGVYLMLVMVDFFAVKMHPKMIKERKGDLTQLEEQYAEVEKEEE